MPIDDLLLNALGFTATGFSIFMWIPQARTTWRSRNDPAKLAGISETTQWLLLIGYLLWGVFGVASQSLWVAAPSAVSMPIALATIVLIHRGRRLAPALRSVSIIALDEPLSGGATIEPSPTVETTTAPVPIISSEAAVGDTTAPDAFTTTGTIPILA